MWADTQVCPYNATHPFTIDRPLAQRVFYRGNPGHEIHEIHKIIEYSMLFRGFRGFRGSYIMGESGRGVIESRPYVRLTHTPEGMFAKLY